MDLDLSALSSIGALLAAPNDGNGLRRVAIDAVQPDPNQPRKTFNEESLAELAASIRSIGIIQPPVVRTSETGYTLISGERRWRAACLLGLDAIDVIVRDDLDARAQLVENIQRDALSHWEIFRFIASELDAGTTQVELARTLGKSGGWVGAYAAVSKMPPPLTSILRKGRVADMTALGQLYRLYKEMPGRAEELLESSEPVTRQMVAAAAISNAHSVDDKILEPAPGPSAGADSIVALHASGNAAAAELDSTKPPGRSTSESISKSAKALPICIRATFDNANWVIEYTDQKRTDGRAGVMLVAEDGSTRYAPLEDLRLQSIECL